jgi:hypothetical protein
LRVESVPVDVLHEALGFSAPISFPEKWRRWPLVQWSMEPDDCILRYIFRGFHPLRHLEFGTWLGDGVLRCVQECHATVWTINLLEGELKPTGEWVYSARQEDVGASDLRGAESVTTDGGVWVRTDSYGAIGRNYLVAGLGKRVCQIYCDSREWDTRAYPDGFFDSAFIDGGHLKDVVESDTMRAMRLVRAGGLMIWHDFCPNDEVVAACPSTNGTNAFVTEQLQSLSRSFRRLFWIEPSWLLVGIRR